MPDVPTPPRALQSEFVPGQMVIPGNYRFWFFPLPTEDGRTIVNVVIQGPGGDQHSVMGPDDLIVFGRACIEQGKAAKTAPSRLIVPDVAVPSDLRRNGGQP